MDEVIPDPNEFPAPPPEPNIIDRLQKWYMALPDKKRHVEFFSAILTIPVLITVIILNINSLNSQKAAKLAVPTPGTTIIQIIQPTATPSAVTSTPTPTTGVTVTPTPSPTPLPTPTVTPTPTIVPLTATPTPATSSGTPQ